MVAWDMSLFTEAERRKKHDDDARRKRSKLEQLQRFHIRRLSVTLRPHQDSLNQERVFLPARLLTCDMHPTYIRIFSKQMLPIGELVSLSILGSDHVYLRGKVTWCRRSNLNSHVEFKDGFPYRLEIKFQFDSIIEKEAIRLFAMQFYQHFVVSGPAQSL